MQINSSLFCQTKSGPMPKQKNKELRFRLWIDINGERFFGPGRAELLHLIESTGSISKAAKSMDMSYKKALEMVDEMNLKASTPFVVAQKGGRKEAVQNRPKPGKKMVKAYRKIQNRICTFLKKDRSLLDLI
jgi:molybdate transport system regulatory protein